MQAREFTAHLAQSDQPVEVAAGKAEFLYFTSFRNEFRYVNYTIHNSEGKGFPEVHFRPFAMEGESHRKCVSGTEVVQEAPGTFRASLDQSQPMDETGMLRPENWVSRK